MASEGKTYEELQQELLDAKDTISELRETVKLEKENREKAETSIEEKDKEIGELKRFNQKLYARIPMEEEKPKTPSKDDEGEDDKKVTIDEIIQDYKQSKR